MPDTIPTFLPIESPLDLSPEEFVVAAQERGFEFVQAECWLDIDERCGCAIGAAAFLEGFKSHEASGPTLQCFLELSGEQFNGLNDGFEFDTWDDDPPHPAQRVYRRFFDYGRAVARAAGLD